ncbi:E3 ubiquitin-protein ligase MGRN1-like [Oppia nitens]|uniref:E3 ubiquitin-protein ligase MGRN1-like n=1 Tax=Oppia nitens TaxID=1686743 RepID=UPI0023DCA498|nr:E3 ubiquitin-protein ligase MGRN1-like [Oppia nitens]
MGNLWSGRQNGRIEEVDNSSDNVYCYPPKSGHYFSSHFIMGGERFESCSPEAYLFGENMDLNFLGSHPTPFPYSAPLPQEPTRTLRALINIRKESLRLIRVVTNCDDIKDKDVLDVLSPTDETNADTNKEIVYNIEFAFDSDVRCAITIHYLCTEEVTSNGLIYTSKESNMSSETFFFKRGPNQLFSQSSHVFNPSLFSDEELTYRTIDEKGEYDGSVLLPVVIHCVAQEGEEPRQSHTLIAVVERNHENTHIIKPLKQKLFVDGLTYLLQEIYGIENKNALTVTGDTSLSNNNDEDIEDNASECVICMSDSRDTLILPCRHLCLCNGCADSLRYQANNCPICRAPFRALLQLKAVRKAFVPNIGSNPSTYVNHHQLMSSNSSTDLVDIPPGYEPISLIEALNGPNSHSLSPFKTNCGGSETPINVRKYHKNEQKSRKGNQMFNTSNGSDVPTDTVTVMTRAPVVRSRVSTASSPTTPEVVVSEIPVSPIKDNVDNNLNIEVNERELWRRSLVTNSKPIKSVDDNGSASSSTSSTGIVENIALQERVRLLSQEKCEDECDYMNENEDKEKITREDNQFEGFAVNAMKDSPGNSSPVSIGISSASYPMLSLRDGIDDQQAMDPEDDLLSVATISSTNNILIRPEDLCDNFNPSDYKSKCNQTLSSFNHNFDTNLLISGAEIPQQIIETKQMDKSPNMVKKSHEIKQMSIRVKLAETEIIDDLDTDSNDV